MNTRTRFASVRSALALAVALAAAACSGGAETGAASVEISDNTYQPATVEVSATDSVTWTNADDVAHTVTFTDGAVSSSDELAAGESFTATFDEPGTYAYVCALHPGMEATVTVTG